MHRSFLLPLLFATLTVSAQYDSTATTTPKKERTPLKDRIWFGGGVGLGFGTVTAIQVDPMVGLFLDKGRKLSTGIGGSYWYYRDSRWNPPLTYDAYGYRLFTRYRVLEPVFLHAEFVHLNAPRRFAAPENQSERLWVPHLLVGGGYIQSAGGMSIYLQVLFDVLQDPNSVYRGQGPIFGGGVGLGF